MIKSISTVNKLIEAMAINLNTNETQYITSVNFKSELNFVTITSNDNGRLRRL